MGNSKSQEYRTLIKPPDPSLWTVLDHYDSHQLWQNRLTKKKFLVYSLNTSQPQSEQTLQLMYFRKLNHAHLVSIEELQSNTQNSTCTQSTNWYLLVENIVSRLDKLRRSLSFGQALTVLEASFCGYHVLNYVYGPLYTSEQMICFNEEGVPKVWVNQNLADSEPSITALRFQTFSNNGLRQIQQSLQEKMYLCVQHLFDTVEQATVNGYPPDFKRQARDIRSFAEGEEYIDTYCRTRGIQLGEAISLQKIFGVEPSSLQSQSYSDGLSLPSPYSNNLGMMVLQQSDNIYTQQPFWTQNHLTVASPVFSPRYPGTIKVGTPFIRSNLGQSSSLPILFHNVNTQMIPTSIKPGQSEDHSLTNLIPPNLNTNDRINQLRIPALEQIKSENNPDSGNEANSSSRHQHIVLSVQSREIIHYDSEELQRRTEEQQQPFEQPKAKDKQKIRQEAIATQQFYHIFDSANLKSDSVLNSSQQQKDQKPKDISASDELKNWQKSLLILTMQQKQKYKKQKQQEDVSQDELYQSQERDKVEALSTRKAVQNFSSQSDMETYIRNKYSQYFKNNHDHSAHQPKIQTKQIVNQKSTNNNKQSFKSQPNKQLWLNKQKDKQQRSQDKQVSSQKESKTQIRNSPSKHDNSIKIDQSHQNISQGFNKPLRSILRVQKKYTFGKIQPNSQQLKIKQLTIDDQPKTVYNKRPLKASSNKSFSKIDQKYEKYVKNKHLRSQTTRQISPILPKSQNSLNNSLKDPLSNNSISSNQTDRKPKGSQNQQAAVKTKPYQRRADGSLSYSQLRGLLRNKQE